MPPEQVLGQHDEVDARSDVYALGSILYEIVTLRPMFDHPNVASVLEATLSPTREPPEVPLAHTTSCTPRETPSSPNGSSRRG